MDPDGKDVVENPEDASNGLSQKWIDCLDEFSTLDEDQKKHIRKVINAKPAKPKKEKAKTENSTQDYEAERQKLLKRCVLRYKRYSNKCNILEMRIPGMEPYEIGNRDPSRIVLQRLETYNVSELKAFIRKQRQRNAHLIQVERTFFPMDGTVDLTIIGEHFVDLWEYIKGKCGKAKNSVSTKLHQLFHRRRAILEQ
ncbi:unnamed protein product [Caenorhabditis nigoni]